MSCDCTATGSSAPRRTRPAPRDAACGVAGTGAVRGTRVRPLMAAPDRDQPPSRPPASQRPSPVHTHRSHAPTGCSCSPSRETRSRQSPGLPTAASFLTSASPESYERPTKDTGGSHMTDHKTATHQEWLAAREKLLERISRAPREKLLPYRERMGGSFNWASSYESDFNFDIDRSRIRARVRPSVMGFRPIRARGDAAASSRVRPRSRLGGGAARATPAVPRSCARGARARRAAGPF
jgi:Bacterial protein of unknown function (DUF899)